MYYGQARLINSAQCHHQEMKNTHEYIKQKQTNDRSHETKAADKGKISMISQFHDVLHETVLTAIVSPAHKVSGLNY